MKTNVHSTAKLSSSILGKKLNICITAAHVQAKKMSLNGGGRARAIRGEKDINYKSSIEKTGRR